MSRQQLSLVVGLFTGHLGLNGYLRKIGKTYILYAEGVSTAMKLLNTCYVKLWQISRGHTFGQSSGEPRQLSNVPVDLFRRFATEIGQAGK